MTERAKNTNDPAIAFELDGKTHVLKLKDYRGRDDRRLRATIGMTVMQAWREALGNSAMDALAGLLWLKLSSGGNMLLQYETVLDKFTLYDLETIRDYTEPDQPDAPVTRGLQAVGEDETTSESENAPAVEAVPEGVSS